MQRDKGSWLFWFWVACAGAFVLATGSTLPDMVAAHFGASGAANGYMTRGAYTSLMLVCVAGLPALLVFATRLAINRPGARINLPNRDYWLAPQRRVQTLAVLRAGILQFGALLVTFLCYAHWLVVRANLTQPVRLAGAWFVGGMVVFLAVLLLWLRAFVRRFALRT